jgi:hypothetical protein
MNEEERMTLDELVQRIHSEADYQEGLKAGDEAAELDAELDYLDAIYEYEVNTGNVWEGQNHEIKEMEPSWGGSREVNWCGIYRMDEDTGYSVAIAIFNSPDGKMVPISRMRDITRKQAAHAGIDLEGLEWADGTSVC